MYSQLLYSNAEMRKVIVFYTRVLYNRDVKYFDS